MGDAFPIVVGHAVLTVGLGFVYFRRARLARPPIGVFNARDVQVVLAAIVLVPYMYLALPLWAVTGLMSVAALSVGAFTLEPVAPRRLAWAVALALVAADVAAAAVYSTRSNAFLAVNDAALALVVVGIANLWAQSGMSARHLAVLAGALTAYDVVATSGLTLMTDLIARLGQVPFLPVAAWDLHDGTGLGIGLGDLLFATVFPLVMRKAFGVGPGRPLVPPARTRAHHRAVPAPGAPQQAGDHAQRLGRPTDGLAGSGRDRAVRARSEHQRIRKGVNHVTKLSLRYARYAISTLSTVGFAAVD